MYRIKIIRKKYNVTLSNCHAFNQDSTYMRASDFNAKNRTSRLVERRSISRCNERFFWPGNTLQRVESCGSTKDPHNTVTWQLYWTWSEKVPMVMDSDVGSLLLPVSVLQSW